MGFWQASAQSLPRELPADLERLRVLVEAGAAPRSALVKAQETLLDQQDDGVLRRTLYGTLKFDEVSDQDISDMVSAAKRRVERGEKRIAELEPLVNDGIYARSSLTPLHEDLTERKRTLALANDRADFLRQLAEMARTEDALQTDALSTAPAEKPIWQRFDGKRQFDAKELKSLTAAFEKKFGRTLPVSAYGNTAFHRSMGYDHQGRLDVALNPDSPEGMWLRWFLEQSEIPYYAFRSAISGSASGAHIHVGPPSLRVRAAD